MKTTFLALGALSLVALGCDSEVQGGGGGAGGAGSGGSGVTATATGTTSGETTGTTTGSNTTSGEVASSSSSGGGGSGGAGGGLGECEMDGGSSAASSGGSFTCETSYTCDAGAVVVSCTDDGTSSTCDCTLDGNFEGTCDNGDEGCTFPLNCCFELLGGVAEPNPGPYGACEGNSSTATSGAGGSAMCDNAYACEGGDLSIACTETPTGADCECKDGQGFVLGTCEDPAATCDYEGSCCYAIFNP